MQQYKNYFKETTAEKIAMAIFFRVATWGPPLFPSYFVYHASLYQLNMHWTAAVLAGAVVEALGIAAMHNLLTYAKRVRERPGDANAAARYQTTKWVASFYISLSILLVVFLDGFLSIEQLDTRSVMEVVAKALLVMASPIGAFTYLIRAEYIEVEESEFVAGQKALARKEAEQRIQDEIEEEKRRFDLEMTKQKALADLEVERAKAQAKIEKQLNKASGLSHKNVSRSVSGETDEGVSHSEEDRRHIILRQLKTQATGATDLANITGYSRSTVNRDLADLRTLDLVSNDKGKWFAVNGHSANGVAK